MFEAPFPPPSAGQIDFHIEDQDPQLEQEAQLKAWIQEVIAREGGQLHFINYIFCSDAYLLKINQEHLQHDTYTDIITFHYSETAIESDIFISVDRVRENAQTYASSYHQELHRVMIHGVLHLLGYGDKTEVEQQQMRQKEEECLQLFSPS